MLAAAPLSRGEQGTIETVRAMRRLIRDGRVDPVVRNAAEEALRAEGVKPRDSYGEAKALFEFVRGHMRFTRDPVNVEQLTTAQGLLLDHPNGDCDEYSILLGSLLESVGIPVRIKVVRRHSRQPWKHVYLEARINDRWVSADPTHPQEPFGWEVPHGDSFVLPIESREGDDVDEGVGQWEWIIPLATAALPVVTDMMGGGGGGGGIFGGGGGGGNSAALDAAKAAEKSAKKTQKTLDKILNALQQPGGAASILPLPPAARAPASSGSSWFTAQDLTWMKPAAWALVGVLALRAVLR